MDFKQLQSFVTVVQEESFTQAAGRLFVSQSTVSTHIHQLESELNSRISRMSVGLVAQQIAFIRGVW